MLPLIRIGLNTSYLDISLSVEDKKKGKRCFGISDLELKEKEI